MVSYQAVPIRHSHYSAETASLCVLPWRVFFCFDSVVYLSSSPSEELSISILLDACRSTVGVVCCVNQPVLGVLTGTLLLDCLPFDRLLKFLQDVKLLVYRLLHLNYTG